MVKENLISSRKIISFSNTQLFAVALFSIFIVSVGLMTPAFGAPSITIEPIDDQILFVTDHPLLIPLHVTAEENHSFRLYAKGAQFASVQDYGNGTGLLRINSDSRFIGDHYITVWAQSLNGLKSAHESFTLSLIDNRAIIEPIDNQILLESDDNLYIPVRTTNKGNHPTVLDLVGYRPLVSFEDYGNGTGMITIDPSSRFIGANPAAIEAHVTFGGSMTTTKYFSVSVIDDPHFYQQDFTDYYGYSKWHDEWHLLSGPGLYKNWIFGLGRPLANAECYGCAATLNQAFGTPLSVDIMSSRHGNNITSEPGMLQYSTDQVSWNTLGSIPGSSVSLSNTHYTLEKMDEPVYLRMAFLESQKYTPAIHDIQINYSPFPVQDLIVTPASDFLDITWQDNPSTVYTVQVTPTGTSDKIEFTTSDNFIKVSNLQPETQYDIVVIAGDDKEELRTKISKTTTSQYNTIQNLDAVLTTRIPNIGERHNPFSSLEIFWDSYSFNANYTVRITEHGSSNDITEITTADTFAKIYTPTHGSKYTIVVLPDGDEDAKSAVDISIPELDPDLENVIILDRRYPSIHNHVAYGSEFLLNLSGKQAQDGIVEFYNKLANTYTEQNITDVEIVQDLDGLSVHEIQDFFRNYMHYSQIEINELSIPDSNLAPSPHIPVFTIVGHIDAEDYDGIGSTPINGILVCAYDYFPSLKYFKIALKHSGDLACDYTSSSGSYIIDDIINDDPTIFYPYSFSDHINIDLAIGVISFGDSDFVLSHSVGSDLISSSSENPYRNSALHPYVTFSDTIMNFNQTMQKIDVHSSGANADAARIVDTISDGLDFFEGYGISPEDLAVRWDHRFGWHLSDTPQGRGIEDPNPDGIFDPFYSFKYNTMFLNGDKDLFPDLAKYDYDDDSKVRYNVLRQLGYHIADVANPKSEIDCGDAVALYDKSDPKCAWLDGWASFVPHLVDDSSMLQINEKGHLVDLETEQITYANGTTLHKFPKTEIDSDEKQTHVGEIIPGQIAATLWDIKDTLVHPTVDILGDSSDNLALGDDEIVENYATNPSAAFKEFYQNWQADPYLTSNTTTIMKLHGMDFALNPKIPGILPPIVTPTSDAPNPISNLNVVSAENSIDVSWDAYENATEYTVYVAESEFADEQEITPENRDIVPEQLQTVTTDTSTSVEVSKPDTEYAIAVVADDDVRTASRMHVTSDSVDTVETPPYTPKTIENLKASKTKSSFDITWDDNGAANYTIRVIEPGFFDDRVEFTTSVNSTTVEDLKPQTQYKIIVAPEDDFDYKQMITKTTKVAPVLEGLDITLDGNFLEISWDDQPEVDEYMVRVIEQPDGYDDRLEYTTTNSTTTVSDLKLSTEYRIVVLPDGHEQPKAAAHITTSSSARTIDPPVTPTDPPTSTPDTVQNLNVTFTHNTISVTWDDDFTNYEVRVFPVGEYTPGEFITDNNYSVNGLTHDTDYRIVVVPDGVEDKKAAQEITTLSPPPIENLLIAPTATSFDISWNPHDGTSEYTVRVIEQPTGTSPKIEYTITETSKTIENLNPNTEYRVVVFSKDMPQARAAQHITTSTSTSDPPPVVPPVTPTDPPTNPPDTVQNLNVTFTHNTISVTWDDDFANYEVRVFPVGEYTPGEFITANNYSVNNLNPDTDYRIVVVPDGEEDKKAAENITTLTEPPIENLLVTPTATSFDISWNPHDDTSEYTVRVIEQPTGTSDKLEYTVTDTRKTVDNLNPNTEYRVVVLPKDTPQSKTAQHMTTLPSTSPPVVPPVTPTDPPVTPTDPPVTPTDPPVTPTDPPVTPTDPPVTPTDPPVTPTDPPVTPTDPPVTPTDPPTNPPDTVQNLDVTFTHNTISVTWDDDFTNYEVRVFPVGEYTPGEFITDNNYFVNGLTHDTDYRIVVVPDGVEDKKAAQEIRTLTLQSIQNLGATATDSSLSISWDDNGAAEYTVRVIQPGHYNDRVEKTTADNFIEIENLQSDTEYKLVVFASADEDTKSIIFTTTLTFTATQPAPPPQQDAPSTQPDTIQNLNVTFTHNTALATWDDDFDSYEVRVTAPGFQALGLSNDNSHNFDNLTPDTDYSITVAPDGDKSKMATKMIRTLPLPTAPTSTPDTIQNLNVTFTHNTALITWDDDFTNYEVRVTAPGFQALGLSHDNSHDFDDLTPDTDYSIVVVPDGDDDKKATTTITTLTEPPIENLIIIPTATSLDISWNPHDGTTEYTVRVVELPASINDRLKYTVTDTSKTVDNLNPDTEYRVVVMPKDTPKARATQHITTLPSTSSPVTPPVTPTDPPTSIPDTVQNLLVESTHNTIDISWDAYENATQYTISVIEQPTGTSAILKYIVTDTSKTIYALKPDTEYKFVVTPDDMLEKQAEIATRTLTVP